MANFVSAARSSAIQSKMDDLFDTFADSEQGGTTITVHKEAQRVLSSVSQRTYAGYGPASVPSNVSYEPESDTFEAIISYNKDQSNKVLTEVGLQLEDGEVMMEVKQACRDYIENGVKTEKITFDSRTFNITSEPIVDKFFGSIRYLYKIKEVR